MPKSSGPGKRVNIWIPTRYLKIWEQIENRSKFVQLCLDDAAGIMAWAILKEKDPEKYKDKEKIEDVVDEFNQTFPVDDLTAKRQDKWQQNSASKPELW